MRALATLSPHLCMATAGPAHTVTIISTLPWRPTAGLYARHTEAKELRHSRLVADSTSSRKPSLIYPSGLETPGWGLSRALGCFVFGHHTDENGQFTHLFLTIYHIILLHNDRVLFIFKFQGPRLGLAGRPPLDSLISGTEGRRKEHKQN